MEAYLESLGRPGPALLAVAGLFALAFLAGRPWVRRDSDLDEADRIFLALMLGFDVLVLCLFPLAWGGWLAHLPLRAVLVLALGTVAFLSVRRLRRIAWRSLPWHALPFAGLALAFLGAGLSYPFSWDDLVYQVTVPLRWHATNGMQVFPDLPYSGFPGAFSLLNLLLIDAGGILAPAVFNAGLWLVLALQLSSLVRAHTGKWQGTILALSFALSWPALIEAVSAYAEIFLVLHIAAMAQLWIRKPMSRVSEPRAQVQLGLLAGIAASIKLTGMIVPALATVLAASASWCRAPRSARACLVRSSAFLLPLLAVVAVFYARPAVETGNPLHPYFASLFTDDEAALASSAYHHDAGKEKFGAPLELSAATLGRFVRIPFQLALGPLADTDEFDGLVGMQFLVHFLLAGCLALWWVRGRARDVRPWIALACALGLYAFWFLTSRQARFLMPACFMLTLAAAFVWPLLSRLARAALTAALPVLSLASIPLPNYHLLVGVYRLQTGSVDLLKYLDFANPDRYVYACQAIQEETPPDARVLLLFEQRGLYIPRDYRIGTPYFQGKYFTPAGRNWTPDGFLGVLAEEHITHVLVGYNVNDPDRMDSYLEKTKPFQEMLVSLIRDGRLETVWAWREPDGMVRHGLYKVR
jgi:hypothetical protein